MLFAYYTAGADDAQPTHGLSGREAEILHHVNGNKSACAAEARLAVHREDALSTLGELEEASNDVGVRSSTVWEM